MPFVTRSSRPTVVVSALSARPEINPSARRRPTPPVQPDATTAPKEPDPDKKAGDYDIGYKRPPKHGQFKKGVSGNPMGRPKGAKGMKAIVRAVLTEKLPVRTPNGVKRISKMEALIHKKAELAFAGNLRAIQACATLYQVAVPDEVAPAVAAGPGPEIVPELFDTADEAILAELKAMLLAELGEQP